MIEARPVARLAGGLLIAAGALVIGLSGLCTVMGGGLLFGEGTRSTSNLLTSILLIATFGGPPLIAGGGLILLGRRIGWSKSDGQTGPGKAFRRIASIMMITVGVVVALQGLASLSTILREPALAVSSILSFAISAGLIYGGVLLWKDKALPPPTDAF